MSLLLKNATSKFTMCFSVSLADWTAILSSSPTTTAIDIDTSSSSILPVQFLPDGSQENFYTTPRDIGQITIMEGSGAENPLTPALAPSYVQPLVPGSYHLVPRSWLKCWRSFNKDLNATCAPPLDCSSMLCHAHGLLSVPCHVEEYLVGLKKTLLGGLGNYPGEVVEILSDCEWAALQSKLNSLSGFSVRFTLDGENISWNMRLCHSCTPAASSSSFCSQSPTHRLPKDDDSSIF